MRTMGAGILTNPTMAKWWPNFVNIFQHHGTYGGVSETSMKLNDSHSVMVKHVFSNFHRPMGTVLFGTYYHIGQHIAKLCQNHGCEIQGIPHQFHWERKSIASRETSDQTLKIWRTLDDLCDFKRTSVTNSWGSINKHEVLFEQERK